MLRRAQPAIFALLLFLAVSSANIYRFTLESLLPAFLCHGRLPSSKALASSLKYFESPVEPSPFSVYYRKGCILNQSGHASAMLRVFAVEMLRCASALSSTLAQPSNNAGLLIGLIQREGRRLILNQRELEGDLKAMAARSDGTFRFRLLDFSQMTLDDQIKASASVDILIGVHGAGLTNMIYMKPGSAVIEIMPHKFERLTFSDLARATNLNYHRVNIEDPLKSFPHRRCADLRIETRSACFRDQNLILNLADLASVLQESVKALRK